MPKRDRAVLITVVRKKKKKGRTVWVESREAFIVRGPSVSITFAPTLAPRELAVLNMPSGKKTPRKPK